MRLILYDQQSLSLELLGALSQMKSLGVPRTFQPAILEVEKKGSEGYGDFTQHWATLQPGLTPSSWQGGSLVDPCGSVPVLILGRAGMELLNWKGEVEFGCQKMSEAEHCSL